MASAAAAPSRWTLSESRPLRYLTLCLFYVSQGVPAGVTIIGIPAWAAASGASSATVASLVAAAYFIPGLKFLIGPLVDRYVFIPMGRRRPWLIGAQGVMTLAWIAAAVLAPGPTDTSLLVAVTFMVSGATAVQDVAADGLAVDLLQEGEEGPASALMFGGAILSMSASGALSGYLLQHYGAQVAFVAFLPVIAVVTILAILIIERPGERRFPWSVGEASQVNRERQVQRWWSILRETFRNLLSRDSLIFIVAVLAIGVSSGLLTPAMTMFATTQVGYDAAGYTALNSAVSLPATGVAILVSGLLAARFGTRNVYATVLVVEALSVLAILILADALTAGLTFAALLAFNSLASSLRQMGSQAMRVALSDSRVGATQMTVYNSLGNLPISAGAGLFAALGGIAALHSALGLAVGLLLTGAVLVALMRTGRAHVAPARPFPPE